MAGIMLVVTRMVLVVTAMVIITTVIVVIAVCTPSTGKALTSLTGIMLQSPLAGRPLALRPLSLLA